MLIGLAEAEARALFERLRPASAPPGEAHDVEELRLAGPEEPDGVDASGTLVLEAFDLPRLRVVAEALARSAVLSFYEAHLAGVLVERWSTATARSRASSTW